MVLGICINGTWYLYNMIIDGEDNLYPVNNDNSPVTILFDSVFLGDNESRQFSTHFCDTYSGTLNYDDNNSTFTLSEFYQTLGGCNAYNDVNLDEVKTNANKFYTFFASSQLFTYNVVYPNLDIEGLLTITSTNGDALIYKYEILSTSSFSKEDSFSIYPNPVKNELFISANASLNGFHAEVFDVLGMLKISKQILTNSINVQDLKKGVYFLLIRDNLGNTTTRKFIK